MLVTRTALALAAAAVLGAACGGAGSGATSDAVPARDGTGDDQIAPIVLPDCEAPAVLPSAPTPTPPDGADGDDPFAEYHRAFWIDAELSGQLLLAMPALRSVEAGSLSIHDGFDDRPEVRLTIGQIELWIELESLPDGDLVSLDVSTPTATGSTSYGLDPATPLPLLGLDVGQSASTPARNGDLTMTSTRLAETTWQLDIEVAEGGDPTLTGLTAERLCLVADSPQLPWNALSGSLAIRTPFGDLDVEAQMTAVELDQLSGLEVWTGTERPQRWMTVRAEGADTPLGAAGIRLPRDWPKADLDPSAGVAVPLEDPYGMEVAGVRFGSPEGRACVEYLTLRDASGRWLARATGTCGFLEARQAQAAQRAKDLQDLQDAREQDAREDGDGT